MSFKRLKTKYKRDNYKIYYVPINIIKKYVKYEFIEYFKNNDIKYKLIILKNLL